MATVQARAVKDQQKIKNACEECGLKTKNYGTAEEKKRRWCLECSKVHNGVLISSLTANANPNKKAGAKKVDRMVGKDGAKKSGSSPTCEDCGLKHSSFGLPEEKKRRWCGACAKNHPGTKCLAGKSKSCEDCGLKLPSYGMESDRKMKWCGACSKKYEGSVCLRKQKMCEGCGLKHTSFGLPAEKKIRWCLACSKQYPGATRLSAHHKMCELCGLKTSNYGLPTDGKRK
eukprot:SAG22_NODE_928_length_6464_cov_2.852789_1_plen_230_part_00